MFRLVLAIIKGIHKILKRSTIQLSEGNFEEKEKLVAGPRWAPDTKTDCRS
jgi:hypothetical protein